MLRKYLGFKFKVTANRDIDSDGEDEFHNSIGDLSTNSKTTNTTKFNKLVGLLPIELRTSLHITVDGFQTDFLEEMKVRCSLPLHLHPSGKELQEDVFFETPAAWTANNGVFGTQAIGRVICFFVMWLPEKGQWPIISEISPKRYRNPKIHRLALIRTYEFLNNGAFEEGPELAKVQYTRNDTRKYVIVGIDSIQRPAQLIRAHLQTQKLEMAMQWYVNNRIDDETWNAFFSHRN